MGHAALLMRSRGYEVSGADANVYPPMSNVLEAAGVDVAEGFDEKRLAAAMPDLVVVGNAMSRGNPEVEWLLSERRVRFFSLPELLSSFILGERRSIVVGGTHGKTTTSALTAFLLRGAGADPGYFIGGVPMDLPCGAELGRPEDPFVIEGDEYDSAFFDKRSKFIHYRPQILVVNNIEFDHSDIFRDLFDVRRSFSHLFKLVPAKGWILANGDDPNCPRAEDVPWTRLVAVGTGESNDLRIADFQEDAAGASFRLIWNGTEWGGVSWAQGGLFNARNAAMAALAAGFALYPGNPSRLSLEPLSGFSGVKRRLEKLHETGKVTVYEDFAHHPSAVGATLRSLRNRFPEAEICAVVEPRSNTMRTRSVQDPLVEALAKADRVLLGAVSRKELLAPDQCLDTGIVAGRLIEKGIEARALDKNADVLEELLRDTEAGGECGVIVFFTNGSFDGIASRYVGSLKEAGSRPKQAG